MASYVTNQNTKLKNCTNYIQENIREEKLSHFEWKITVQGKPFAVAVL